MGASRPPRTTRQGSPRSRRPFKKKKERGEVRRHPRLLEGEVRLLEVLSGELVLLRSALDGPGRERARPDQHAREPPDERLPHAQGRLLPRRHEGHAHVVSLAPPLCNPGSIKK